MNDEPSGHIQIRRGAIGILAQGRQFLVVRRAPRVVRGGYWCFPGGHLEPGETSRVAVQREIAEELGLEVFAYDRVGAVRLPEMGYVLAVWRVRRTGGNLRLAGAEISEIGWYTAAQIRSIRPSLPSNVQVLKMLGV